jgi:thiamine biosynthesis lipoprotein
MPEPAGPKTISRRELLRLEGDRLPPEPSPDPPADHWVRVHRTAMACRFEVTLSGEHAVHLGAAREALAEADRVEELLTVFRETSEVSRLNALAATESVVASPELFALLRTAVRLHADTGGAFDPTSTPLLRTWGFLRRQGRLPTPEEIAGARAVVGLTHVELLEASREVRFGRLGVELSFGSIGKGYALDAMAEDLRRRGVPGALLSAGGSSLVAFGQDGGFPVDVRSRRVGEGPLFRLDLRDAAQATSGAGEQFIEVEGRRYGHVIDPRTGWPAAGVLSATAVADRAADADALSTAFLIGGPALAERYCAEHPGVLALLVPEDEPDRRLVYGRHSGVEIQEAG